MAIKISACVITKNEENNIARWLQCMNACADEMIVVDTGSNDATVAMAEAAGAKVYHFEWINDFSAAKNYALEQATGDWILFLDADEYFTEKSQKKIRAELQRFDRDEAVACLLCRRINIDSGNDNRIISTILLPRVFRNSPCIRYKWPIHEQLENNCGNKKMVFASELEILHTGYSEVKIRSKYERNMAIMLHELETAKSERERLRLYPYITDAYNSIDDYENAIKYARKCIDNNLQIIGSESKFYEIISLAMYNSKADAEDTLSFIREAEERFPEEPFFEFVRGLVLFTEGDYAAAERAFVKGLDLRSICDERMRAGEGVSDTSRGLLRHVYEKLGIIYDLKGNMSKAIDNLVMSLRYYRYRTEPLARLCYLLKSADPVEVIRLMDSIYDKQADADYLAPILGKYIGGKVFVYYGKHANNVSQADLFLAVNRYEAASALFAQDVREYIGTERPC